MNFCHVKIEIDLFDYKQKILSSLGTDDIEYELKRRKETDIYVKDQNILYKEIDIELSELEDDIIYNLYDDELISELEDREYEICKKGQFNTPNLLTKNDICKFLDIRSWSTNEQILSEINNIL